MRVIYLRTKMENIFLFYFKMGLDHILDWAAVDHLLFLLVLCAVYTILDWQKVLILVTAFTIGHCFTLIISGLDLIRIPALWIELAIPATIMASAVYNINYRAEGKPGLLYGTALCFGFIHGLGFSNTFRALLFPGEEASLVKQLLAFNLGIELGQVLIVILILLTSYIVLLIFKVNRKNWNLLLSGLAFIYASYLFVERLQF